MKHTVMTMEEFDAWKHGSFTEYSTLISRKHWLWSHIRGQADRMYDAEDSMSVFSDHQDSRYLKYKEAYDKASAKREKWESELKEVESKLVEFM